MKTVKNEYMNLSKCFIYVVPEIKKPGNKSRLCLVLLVARTRIELVTSGL